MTDVLWPARPGQLLSDLDQLVTERVPAELEIPARFSQRTEAAEQRYRDAMAQQTEEHRQRKAAADAEYEATQREARVQFEADYQAVEHEYRRVRSEILSRFSTGEKLQKENLQEAQWEATAVFEAAKAGAAAQRKDLESQLVAVAQQIEAMHQESTRLIAGHEQARLLPEPAVSPPATLPSEPLRRLADLVSETQDDLQRLRERITPRLVRAFQSLLWFLLLLTVSLVVARLALGRGGWIWAVAGVTPGLIAWVVLTSWLQNSAERRITEAYLTLRQALAQADALRQAIVKAVDAECARQHTASADRLQRDLDKAGHQFSDTLAGLSQRKTDEMAEADHKYPALLAEITARRDRRLLEADQKHQSESRHADETFSAESQRLLDEDTREKAESQRCYQQQWEEMSRSWLEGMADFKTAIDAMNSECQRLFPDWSGPAWNPWTPAAEIPPAICFGQFGLDLRQIKGGVPRDPRLQPPATEFCIPALLPFPHRSLLLLKADGQGRDMAIRIIQAAMLRLLASMPPGKVRFTIIDPVGLGENFSAFMHLADYDEKLVASRIWTDTSHIERRLTDLTEHMENVLQLYLRNEFETIQDYNRSAGELAEPYRVLVVANFPVNFSENAARRLLSIVASGARCGVYTILSLDSKLRIPRHFDLADLESHALTLSWLDPAAAPGPEAPPPLVANRANSHRQHRAPAIEDMIEDAEDEVPNTPTARPAPHHDAKGAATVNGLRAPADPSAHGSPAPAQEPPPPAAPAEPAHFVWQHPQVGKLALEPVLPPDAERFTEIVRHVGQAAKDAGQVQVPFACVAPPRSEWWTGDSRESVSVPLGRSGAMKLQYLHLGKGTSQHVLIAGKTGSGKSTLLHVLVANVALRYSPDEIELFLVDFKKGVEFKAYAGGELPHARVIAIESEREFGRSVLERLDLELKNRGDLYRELGVQDLKGFRAARPGVRLPRILLVVDEFQELFVEDDRIAQDSTMLLDRLVRQGRAFGIHVMLGSQTLAGSYSLPRSTIGQMAVRIALQCSESDAHLILSEDNTAARLLTRPGEAIYNDANGLFEGNHPFQVAWLPDPQREVCMADVREMARQRNYRIPPPIVFEGNVAADARRNPLLADLLEAPAWPPSSRAARAWVGAAVAIKDPTAAEFSRQGGTNLLVVGHREESALGVLSTAMISLAAQCPPAAKEPDAEDDPPNLAQFYVFDSARPGTSEAAFWDRVAGSVPHAVKKVAPRQIAEAMTEILAEVTRRQQAGQEDAPPIYLILSNLSRFRDLRKSDDDFGFSRMDDDKPPSPAKQFAEILREGPALGVHSLAWCDTYSTVSRYFDRQSLRDLELRVVFHMNAADSSNLLDSPAASMLGVHRALLYDEGQGWIEKFIPYGVPSEEWLAQVKDRLGSRG